jgi:hypothetical protein
MLAHLSKIFFVCLLPSDALSHARAKATKVAFAEVTDLDTGIFREARNATRHVSGD